MGSGLLYAGLIVIWGVYFIPRWLRRHDELSESRSIEKFDNAMRILSRREATPDKRYVVMPPRPERSESSRSSRPAAGTSRPVTPVSSVTFRRRRILAGLLLVTLVVSVLTPLLSAVPWWAPVLLVVVTLAYLVHCRLQARTRHQVDRTRAAVQRRSMSRLMRFDAIERLMTVRRELAEERADEERRWQEAEAAEERLRAEDERRRVEAEGGWSPVPVPLPTYVSKPVAPRRASSIDVSDPSTWSTTRTAPSEPSVPSVPAQAAHADPAPAPTGGPLDHLLADAAEADEELDAIITRRAVND